jgi:hypothetical protein
MTPALRQSRDSGLSLSVRRPRKVSTQFRIFSQEDSMYRQSCMVWMGRKQVVLTEQGEELGYLSNLSMSEAVAHFLGHVRTTRAFRSVNVQNHVHTLLDFN